jgi:hypothetical protein
MTKTKDTLDERIAAALKPDAEWTSVELGSLLGEVEAAAALADETASEAHRMAIDPSQIVDTKSVAATVATAALHRDRLRASLPLLTERSNQAAEREYAIAWTAKRDAIEAQRDGLVQKLRERYPALVAELIDLVQRIAPIDAEIKLSNSTRPDGEHALQNTEETAREVLGFGVAGHNGLLSLVSELKLPKLLADDNLYQYLWPLAQPSLAAQMAAAGAFSLPEYNWRDWPAELDKRERHKEIDNDAMKDFYQQREREREEREKIAIEKAKEDDRQAYRERGWPARG